MPKLENVRYHTTNRADTGLGSHGGLTQLSFTLRGFLGQDVAHIGVASFDLASARDPKTLGRTSVGFHL
jgi:hypothetical protein